MRTSIVAALVAVGCLAACSDSPPAGRDDGTTLIDVVDDAGFDVGGIDDAGAIDTAAPDDVALDLGTPDAIADATDAGPGDVVEDTVPDDAAADAGPADVGEDTAPPDVADDTTPDVPPDVVEDTAPDVAEDTTPDVPDTPVTSPWETGPHGSQRFDEEASIPLGGGSRDMDVRIYVPTDISQAPYPVVVFSHGFQLGGEDYNTFGDRMASHGIVGVFPSYGDSAFRPLTHVELADLVSGWIDWVEAESARGGSRLAFIADPERIGAAGHSRGGKQSILAAIEDDRIAAVFGVDPVDSGPPFGDNPTDYPSVAPERMSELAIPSAYLGSGLGGQGGLGGLSPACAPSDDNYEAYFDAAPSPAYEYLVEDSGHLDYTDDCGLICFTCPSEGDAGANRSFATATLIAFFEVYLDDDARYRPWLDGAEVTSGSPRVVWQQR